jgi:hypothetical protein
MIRRALPVFAVGVLAVVAAGCGGPSTALYTAKGTAACLTKKGFTQVTTNPTKVGFIAGFAENGGVRATAKDGNELTIAFAADDTTGVTSTEKAFRRFAPAKLRPRMADIMNAERNAVLVWTVTPSTTERDDVIGCLHS